MQDGVGQGVDAAREDTAPILALALIVVAMSLVALGRSRTIDPAPEHAKVVSVRLSAGARALRDGRPMDLNSASAADLELLPRIGPALAERIVAGRPYENERELLRVRGIGTRTLERLAPLIHVPTPELPE